MSGKRSLQLNQNAVKKRDVPLRVPLVGPAFRPVRVRLLVKRKVPDRHPTPYALDTIGPFGFVLVIGIFGIAFQLCEQETHAGAGSDGASTVEERLRSGD